MPITADIVESWRRPRVVVRRLLARGASEPFALSLLLTFLILAFAAQAPFAAREATLNPQIPLIQRLFAAFLVLLATIPFWYFLAAIGHWLGRAFGGTGSYYSARLALFWALVATAPAMLLQGLVQGFIGANTGTVALGLLTLVTFLTFWSLLLREVEGI